MIGQWITITTIIITDPRGHRLLALDIGDGGRVLDRDLEDQDLVPGEGLKNLLPDPREGRGQFLSVLLVLDFSLIHTMGLILKG